MRRVGAVSALFVTAVVACASSSDGVAPISANRRDAGDLPPIPPPNPAPADAGRDEGVAPVVAADGGLSCPGTAGTTTLCDDKCFDLSANPDRCGACTTLCNGEQICAGSKCVAPASCKALRVRAPTAGTGVHTLRIADADVPAYCDMKTDGGGWTLAFRVSAGVPGDPLTLYASAPLNDTIAAEVTTAQTGQHYASRILTRWNQGVVVEEAIARVIGPGNATLADVVFDAKGSTPMTLWSKERLQKSPWTDVGSAEPTLFSVTGGAAEQRRFMIHNAYAGCAIDSGWLIVHGTPAATTLICSTDYEDPFSLIRIYFAPGTTAQTWKLGVPEAKAFAILVR